MPYDNPKPRRIVDEAALQRARDRIRCEVCHRRMWTPCHPHHIRTKGAGGDDVDSNLLSCCFECHERCHRALIPKAHQRYLVSRRKS
jgi:hypothetical protein